MVELEQLLPGYVTRSFELLAVALALLRTVRGEHQRITVISDKHRRERTRALGVKFLRLGNLVTRTFFLPLLDLHTSVLTGFGHILVGVGFEVQIVTLGGVFVLTLILQRLGTMQEHNRVLQLVLVAQRVLVTVHRTRVVQYPVTLALLERHVSLQRLIRLRGDTSVAGLVDIRRGIVFPDSELLIRSLDPLLNTATCQTQHRQYE